MSNDKHPKSKPSGIGNPLSEYEVSKIGKTIFKLSEYPDKLPDTFEMYDYKGEIYIKLRDDSKPSEPSDGYWLFASRKKGKYPQRTEKAGKWLIFVNNKEVDSMWAKIKNATEQGQLGKESKVSTPKPKSANIGYKAGEHVICVYTYDWTDSKDVRRIREELRKLGVVDKIPYKSDDDSRYSAKGDKAISKYYK